MKVKFSRCNSSDLTELSKVDGQLTYVKDTGENYLDVGEDRVKITDIVFLDKETDFESIETPLSTKLYYAKDTNNLMYYTGEEKVSLNELDATDIKFTNEYLSSTNISDALTELANKTQQNEQSVTQNTSDISGLQGQVATLIQNDSTHEGRLDSIDTSISSMQEDITNLKKLTGTEGTNITKLEKDIQTLQTNDTKQDTEIETLQTNNTKQDQDIQNLKDKDTSLEEEIQSLQQKDITQDTEIAKKLDTTEANDLIKDVKYDATTATFTFTPYNGEDITVDLPLESTVKSGRYDAETNSLILVLVDNSEISIPVTKLIDIYTGGTTANIKINVSDEKEITATIVNESISETLLDSDLQAKINKTVDLTPYAKTSEVNKLLDNKVDKVEGKGLSDTNFTLEEKTKLSTLNNYDDTEITEQLTTLEEQVNTNITNIENKVDKDGDKVLSTNDFTTELKTKLENIEANANKYTLPKASITQLGGIKIGENLTITDDGTVNAKDTNTTYKDMQGATDSENGKNGLVPQPTVADKEKFLRGDGTWETPKDTTYVDATIEQSGLMSKEDKKKLEGIDENANKYTLPKATTTELGGVTIGQNIQVSDGKISVDLSKVTVNEMEGATGDTDGKSGLVPKPTSGQQNSYLKGDGTWAVPENTTYEKATTLQDGLMSKEDKEKLETVAKNANNYTLPTAGKTLGGVKTTSEVVNNDGYTASPIIGGVVYYKDTNTTYTKATTTKDGLMSQEDKTKLESLNNYDDADLQERVGTLETDNDSNKASISSLETNIENKVDKVPGKVLSTNDYTSTEKLKLQGIATGATKVEKSTVNGNIKINGTETPVYTKEALTSSDVTTALGYTPPKKDTTYTSMQGASEDTPGKTGLVPVPSAGEQNKYLKGDGTWQTIDGENTTYTLTQDTQDGHKLTFKSSKDEITTITIPDNNTTYKDATTTQAGLLSIRDKQKLDSLSNYDDSDITDRLDTLETDNTQNKTNIASNTSALANKVDKVSGKVLSSNDYTSTDKTKLSGIETGATKNVASEILPKANGEASLGTDTGFARGDHIHPLQTTVSGNAGTATKLKTAQTIKLTGAVTGQTTFDGSTAASITTTLGNIDASKITSGTIDIQRLPAGAIETIKVVTDDEARFKLTSTDVQNGDCVKVTDTGKMYMVKDQTQLTTEEGYEEFVAGTAAVASSCTGNAATATKLASGKTIGIDGAVTGAGVSFDGSKNITIHTTSLDATMLQGTTSINTTGNAATATTATNSTNATNATNSKINATNPTAATNYYPTFVDATSGNKPLRVNDGLVYNTLEGTTDTAGKGILIVGNTIASGTAKNKTGTVRIYNANTGYTDIIGTSSTSNYTITLPALSGTLVTTGGTQNLTNKTYNGYKLADASAKGVDSTIETKSTSTNLPTSQAVATFVEGKGYKTTDNNYYPTTWAWTNGTTGGPTAKLTGSGMSEVSVAAIPTASATVSGIITTGAQTLAGAKTFSASPVLGTNKITTSSGKTITFSDADQTVATTSTSQALTGKTYNGLTLTNNATGFAIKGGSTTAATLTVTSSMTLGAAAAKAVDSSITAASESANLPTSAAVAKFVEGKGYKTTDNNTTYTFATGDSNGTIKVTPSSGSAQNVAVKGLSPIAYVAKGSGTSKFLREDGTWQSTPNSNTVPSAHCTTAAGTAAKTATCSNYVLTANTYLHILIQNANSATSVLTLSVNGQTAKPIFINGSASSASNYTLPAGTYIVFYDGTQYQFRTDGKIPGSISGDAKTVNGHTVEINVPANAKFTDNNTTYSAGTGISFSGTTINNSGVRSIAAGSANGTISVNTNGTSADVKVTGLGAAAYMGTGTSATTVALGNHTHSYAGSASAGGAAKQLAVTTTNPTSGTWYYPIWGTAASGSLAGNANDGLRYYSLQGTTTAKGDSILQVGNATATGTTANKTGQVRIYAEKAGFATLKATAGATAETIHTFPNTAGTVLNSGTTSYTATLTSGTKIGDLKINGTTTALYAPSGSTDSTKIPLAGSSAITGTLAPKTTNATDLGTSSLKWRTVYATTFNGALSGNATSATSATSATKLSTKRTIKLTGAVTGSTTFDGSGDATISTTAASLSAVTTQATSLTCTLPDSL